MREDITLLTSGQQQPEALQTVDTHPLQQAARPDSGRAASRPL